MTALTVGAARPGRRRAVAEVVAAWMAPVALVAGLAVVVGLRLWAIRAGLDALGVGLAFGLGLVGLVAWGRDQRTGEGRLDLARDRQSNASSLRSIAVGVVVGLGLLALTVLAPAVSGVPHLPGLGRPAAPFVLWAAITILVASAEEALLRGALFDRIAGATRGVRGVALAVVVTSIVFALMHVPVYGWHVVPLDLAVGCLFGGLRIATRGIAAPAAAHAIADLGTWWL